MLSLWMPHSILEVTLLLAKKIDPVVKLSGSASRHVSAGSFIMHQKINRLKMTWSVENEFQEFISRKGLYNDKEKSSLHENLASQFFDDFLEIFDNHFVKQWYEEKLLQIAIASTPQRLLLLLSGYSMRPCQMSQRAVACVAALSSFRLACHS